MFENQEEYQTHPSNLIYNHSLDIKSYLLCFSLTVNYFGR